jgi:hypothetical protein
LYSVHQHASDHHEVSAIWHAWAWVSKAELLCTMFTQEQTRPGDRRPSQTQPRVNHDPQTSNCVPNTLRNASIFFMLKKMMDGNYDLSRSKKNARNLGCVYFSDVVRQNMCRLCGWSTEYIPGESAVIYQHQILKSIENTDVSRKSEVSFATLHDIFVQCEAAGEYERGAALAIFHLDINSSVQILKRCARVILTRGDIMCGGESSTFSSLSRRSRSEMLNLVAVLIAGYTPVCAVGDDDMWLHTCNDFLQHEDLQLQCQGNAYIMAILKFLRAIRESANETINDTSTFFSEILVNEGIVILGCEYYVGCISPFYGLN